MTLYSFLEENRDLFPQGSLPNCPDQMAAIAIRIYRIFAGIRAKEAAMPHAAIADAIITDLNSKREGGKP